MVRIFKLGVGIAALAATTISASACSGPQDVALPKCVEGPAAPLAPERVISVLREHGFSAQAEHKFLCAPRVVSGVTNAPPGDTSSATSERAQREGTVFCGVEKRPFPKAFLQRYEDSKKVGWAVGNVDCAVYSVKAHKDEQVHRLELAMAELARLAGETSP